MDVKWRSCLTLLVSAGLCVALAGCADSDADERQQVLVHLNEQCVQSMVAATCRVMQGQDSSQLPSGVETVLVAGVGPIRADLYRSLREQGEGMCQHLLSQCQRDWQGNACQTARALYGAG